MRSILLSFRHPEAHGCIEKFVLGFIDGVGVNSDRVGVVVSETKLVSCDGDVGSDVRNLHVVNEVVWVGVSAFRNIDFAGDVWADR